MTLTNFIPLRGTAHTCSPVARISATTDPLMPMKTNSEVFIVFLTVLTRHSVFVSFPPLCRASGSNPLQFFAAFRINQSQGALSRASNRENLDCGCSIASSSKLSNDGDHKNGQ